VTIVIRKRDGRGRREWVVEMEHLVNVAVPRRSPNGEKRRERRHEMRTRRW
jgi:hypothetical protein